MFAARGAEVIKRCWLQWWLCCLVLCGPLARAQDEALLDVSIQVFSHREPAPVTASAQAEPGAPATVASKPVEAVREAETRYLPMYLRFRLEQSMSFVAVRVLPLLDNGAELRISGEILRSDGAVLELAIKAQDSSGRVWLDQLYAGTAVASESLSDDALAEDPFAAVFSDIVRDLQGTASQLNAADVRSIKTIALLRYGLGLVPSAFTPYLDESAEGVITLKRLPASDDPILGRILAIREREYLFIDVVDEEYRQFYDDVKPVYDLWRQFQREQTDSTAARTARELNAPSDFRRGSYRALQESYNNYRWAKLQELYVDELGEGFTNEVEPTELELNDSLFRLTGSLDQQYREWRRILAELFTLETQ
jgi:hypothetical protein